MKEIVTYLTFPGTCRDAMTFYASALGGDLELMRAGDTGHCAETDRDLIMHARLRLEHGTLMASDALSLTPRRLTLGNNFSISLDCSSEAEQERLFHALGEGGTVTMPLADTFWGARFGMIEDRFGIQWMLNLDRDQPA